MMLIKLLKAERMKLKRSPVWLAFLIMPVIPALLGTLNYMGNVAILKSEWYSLWTQHTLFTCYFFLPVMIGIYCAYLIRLEHNNQNWNKLLTMPTNLQTVFIAKLLTAAIMIFVSELWIALLFFVSGKAVGMSAPPPYRSVVIWCLFGTLGGTVMAAIQLLLSIYLKSFALPVGISFAGGLSGMVFLAKDLGHIWPYSLMAYGMNSNSPQQMLESGYLGFAVTCAAFLFLLILIAKLILAKKEL